MIRITDAERRQLEQRFPRTAEFVSTRHHCFLVARDTSEEARFLFGLRGVQAPQTRKERNYYLEGMNNAKKSHRGRKSGFC